jgi:hypothetical protein
VNGGNLCLRVRLAAADYGTANGIAEVTILFTTGRTNPSTNVPSTLVHGDGWAAVTSARSSPIPEVYVVPIGATFNPERRIMDFWITSGGFPGDRVVDASTAFSAVGGLNTWQAEQAGTIETVWPPTNPAIYGTELAGVDPIPFLRLQSVLNSQVQGGTLRVAPLTNSGESSIGFYRNADQSGSAAGDRWVLGQGSWGVGAGNFSIGTLTRDSCISIDAQGATTFNYPVSFFSQPSVTIGNRQVGTRPWVAGRFAGSTVASTIIPRTSDGHRGFTVARASTVGEYVVSWTTPHPNGGNYVYFAQAGGLQAIVLAMGATATSLTISFYTYTGSQADPVFPGEATFMIL